MHGSRSTFVPLFLSHRPPASSGDNIRHISRAHRTDTDLTEKSQISTEAMSPKGRTLFGEQDSYEPSLPRSEVSSSTKSRSGTHQHKKHKSRPRPARTGSSTSTATRSSARTRPRPRRKITYATRLRVAVESKLRLTIAFGFAVFASLIIYIALFVTKTSSGPLFHILSIVLLLCLGAVMIHSLVRFLALNSELKAHRSHRAGLKKTPSARGWNISRPLPQFTKSSTLDEKADEIGQADGGYENDDFPVFQAGGAPNHYEHHENPFDDTHDIEAQHHTQPLQHPPPTYGNTRTSIVSLLPKPPSLPHPSLPNDTSTHPNLLSP